MARTDLRFGGPLPRQLPNQPPSHPRARVYEKLRSRMLFLSGINLSFPRVSLTLGQVNDVLLSDSPLLREDLHGLVVLQQQPSPAGSTGIGCIRPQNIVY